ncbi:coiled-coil protein [Cryptosporidium sp. chipmunk genotype I]|uniref:coiled-coil protein n=1 Tax=Cryptosporidium sp. chipmunk genotype I TaxID=1280935 RepID=UPI00351A2DAA|nr:coiled-coil protein [Cryptosporidium sp. chipmunk genotype I]
MYKSAHEEFFDFILKSHVSDPKLTLNHETKPDESVEKKKLSVTPGRNFKSEFDENVHASNKSRKKNRKLNIENDSMLLIENPKTTKELLKELAQTVKEGQSLQKDVEVLKKVVFNQNSRSNQFCFVPNGLGIADYNFNELDQSRSGLISNNYFNEQNLGSSGQVEYYINGIESIDCSQKSGIKAREVPVLRMNAVDTQNNIINAHSVLQHFKFNLIRILRRMKRTEQVQVSIKILYQQLKSEVIYYIEEEKAIIAKLVDELKSINSVNFRCESMLREKDALLVKINASIETLNIENKDLNERYNAVLKEKEIFENEMSTRLHNLEKENIDLKTFTEKMKSEYEQTKSELKKTKDQSNEFDKFMSQLKNMGMIEKIEDSKYLVKNENRSLNDELKFLKDLLKDKRDREELLHKNISQLSDENSRLNTNYIENKACLDKKIRENCILQSILENYKERIGELEEKNFSLQSEINSWKNKIESGFEEEKKTKIKISQLESELQLYKNELKTKSLEFNNSLSRLGQAYVELNETKQLLKDSKHALENFDEKIKLLNRENKELNDALSSQFHLNRKKEIEIESLKKDCEKVANDLENERLSNDNLRKKITELEINYSKVENERFEIHKELNNKCIIEIEKKESLERVSKEYSELKKELIQKDLQINKLRGELKETVARFERESLNKINLLESQLNEKFKRDIHAIEESKRIIRIENENLLEEVIHQKKMIQELIYEKISLNNEVNSLKEVSEVNKKQFENSIQILSKELSALQELGNSKIIDYQGTNNIKSFINNINKLNSEVNLLDAESGIHQVELHRIQSTTAPPSNYSILKVENDCFSFDSDIFHDKFLNTPVIDCSDFFQVEACLSAQCEMAYIDIISQTERFRNLSNKLKSLEEILIRNGEKSISEIVLTLFRELDDIGISSRELLEVVNSENKSKIEIDNELSNRVTEISRAWVLEAEASKQILDYAHKIRNVAAKERMMWVEKKLK